MIATSLPIASSVRLSPFWILPARLVLGVGAQLLVAGIFALKGHPDPWNAALPWWTVSGTLIDVGSLLLLSALARREGVRITDWIRIGRWRAELKTTLWVVPLLLVLAVSGGMGAGFLVYGSPQPAPMGGLPLGAALYSTFIWPLVWAFSEELTYTGYLAPRIEAITRNRTATIVLVASFWAVQHIALPMKLDAAFMLHRALSALPVAVGATLVFLRTRRLLPLIVGHWVGDALAALTAVLLPAMQAG